MLGTADIPRLPHKASSSVCEPDDSCKSQDRQDSSVRTSSFDVSRADSAVRWVRQNVSRAGPLLSTMNHAGSQGGEGALFAEINALKKATVGKEADDGSKFTDSCFGRIARSKVFEWLTIGVIVLNALAIGWDADYSARFGKDDNLFKGPVYFAVMECFFCAYFSGEILIRFVAYRVKLQCIWDAWFVFDGVLVLMMVIETLILPFAADGGGPLGGLNILKLLRLLRITRMAKLMRAFPQLMMIVKGIAAATRAVVWTGFLLVIVTYTWAILFTNEYHQGYATDAETEEWAGLNDLADPTQYGMDFFGSMGKSMLSLLVMGTILDDVTACTDAIRRSNSWLMLAAFIIYILLNSFTMMNMLVGILVEVVGSTAEGEKTRMVEEGVKEAIITIFSQMDKDQSGSISKEEFISMKRDPKVMRSLKALDVKEKQFDQYCDLLFQPDEDGNTPNLTFKTLINCIVRLRPGTAVNALDFASFKQSVLKSHNQLRDRILRIEELCTALANAAREDSPAAGACPAPGSPVSRGKLPPPPGHPADPAGVTSDAITSFSTEQSPGNSTRHPASSPGSAAEAVVSFALGQTPASSARHGPLPPLDWPKKRINAGMLEDLERTPSEDIINELQRRLGVERADEAGTPTRLLEEQLRARSSEAFMTLGVPQQEPEWREEILTC